jgi:hypothetical protein
VSSHNQSKIITTKRKPITNRNSRFYILFLASSCSSHWRPTALFILLEGIGLAWCRICEHELLLEPLCLSFACAENKFGSSDMSNTSTAVQSSGDRMSDAGGDSNNNKSVHSVSEVLLINAIDNIRRSLSDQSSTSLTNVWLTALTHTNTNTNNTITTTSTPSSSVTAKASTSREKKDNTSTSNSVSSSISPISTTHSSSSDEKCNVIWSPINGIIEVIVEVLQHHIFIYLHLSIITILCVFGPGPALLSHNDEWT